MTTTDVATTPQQGAGLSLVPTASEQITAALDQWVGGMALSIRGAEYLVDTPMCPDSFWPLPPNVTTCKLPKQPIGNEPREQYLARRQVATYTLGSVVRYGLQLGLPPEVAVQGIFPIGGRMSMYAEQMVALIKSRGHGHRVVERSRTRCVIEVRRTGNDEWRRFEFTIEDAVSAGYVPNAGPNAGDHGKWPDGNQKKSPGNPKYLTNPAAMLYARATSIGCTTEFPDVLRGLVTTEEMQDEQRSQPVDITVSAVVSEPAERATRAAILAAAGQSRSDGGDPDVRAVQDFAAADRAENDTPAPAMPEMPIVERVVLPITDPQRRQLGALMGQLDVSGAGSKERRLRIASTIAGRELGSANDLTQDEASMVIDTLTSISVGDSATRRRLLAELDGTATATTQVEVDADDYDPTTERDWPMDGSEAAAEGQR